MKAFVVPVILPSSYRGKSDFYLHSDRNQFFKSEPTILSMYQFDKPASSNNSIDRHQLGIFGQGVIEYTFQPLGFLVINADWKDGSKMKYNFEGPIELEHLPSEVAINIVASSVKWGDVKLLTDSFFNHWFSLVDKFQIIEVDFYVPYSPDKPVASELALDSELNTELRFNLLKKTDPTDSATVEPFSGAKRLQRVQEDISQILNSGLSDSDLSLFPIQIYMDKDDYVRLKINGLHISVDTSESHNEGIGVANNLTELIDLVNSFK